MTRSSTAFVMRYVPLTVVLLLGLSQLAWSSGYSANSPAEVDLPPSSYAPSPLATLSDDSLARIADEHLRYEAMQLADSTFAQTTKSQLTPWMVIFTAKWCNVCNRLAPTFSQLASALHPHTKVGTAPVDRAPSSVTRFQVKAFPTVFLFTEGGIVRFPSHLPMTLQSLRQFAAGAWRVKDEYKTGSAIDHGSGIISKIDTTMPTGVLLSIPPPVSWTKQIEIELNAALTDVWVCLSNTYSIFFLSLEPYSFD